MPENLRSREIETPEERENRYRERLMHLAPTFLEIREKMGIGDDVGFGYLPEVHSNGHTMGSLPEIKKSKNGEIKYSVPGFLGQGHEYRDLPKEDDGNIIVMPADSKKAKIVSIYDPYEEWDIDKTFADLIDAPDDIFVGLIAHELAHSYNSKSKFPPEIRSVLENRYRENNPDSGYKWRYNTHDEEEMDLIASLLGYKRQVIAKIDFMIARLNKFGPNFKNREGMIKSLEARKKEVLKYCP